MTTLADLLNSYLDLRRHFDPAAASAAGTVSADARLGAFDARSMREHLAAFRSVAGAIEDLEIDDLEEEIDRTALLADLGSLLSRFEQERPHVHDPGFWVEHAYLAVQSLLERPEPDAVAPAALARIAALPDFLESARGTIRRPPLLLVDAALARLGPLGELLVRAAAVFGPGAPGGVEAMNTAVAAALEALTRFGRALRDEIEPQAGWAGTALGEERLRRRIEEAYAIRAGPAELARWAEELLNRTAPVPPVPAGGHADALAGAQDRAREGAVSPVRRALRSAVAAEGWSLYAASAAAKEPERSRRLRAAAAELLVDVGLHAGGMTPGEAACTLVAQSGLTAEAAEREVRRIAASPGSGLAAAAGYREIVRLWQAYAQKRRPDPDAFHEELLRYGALSPALAGWGMGISG